MGAQGIGFDSLIKTLNDLGHTVPELRDDVGKILHRPRDAMRRHAPVRSRNLQRNIIVKELPESQDNELHFGVGVFAESTINYAVYVEYGTGIYAENGQGRKTPWVYPVVTDQGLQFFTTSGNHPQPFIRPGWDEEENNVVAFVEKATVQKIERITG